MNTAYMKKVMSTMRLKQIQTEIDKWNENDPPNWVSSHIVEGFVLSVNTRTLGLCNLWHFCKSRDDMPAHHVNLKTWLCHDCRAEAPANVRAAYKLSALKI